jgi:hypothetical protein
MSHPEHHMYVDTNKRTASLSQSEFFCVSEHAAAAAAAASALLNTFLKTGRKGEQPFQGYKAGATATTKLKQQV